MKLDEYTGYDGLGLAALVRSGRVHTAVVDLTDAWAVRELTICVRSLDELPPYARQLVEHLRASA